MLNAQLILMPLATRLAQAMARCCANSALTISIAGTAILDKSGKPNVRIDSKIPLKALMLKFGKKSIEIKSIVNSTGEKGLSQEVMRVILGYIDKDFTIIIDQDVSNGFWDKVIQKHPEYNWIKK